MKNIKNYQRNKNCSFKQQEIKHLDRININRHCENRKIYTTLYMQLIK